MHTTYIHYSFVDTHVIISILPHLYLRAPIPLVGWVGWMLLLPTPAAVHQTKG